MVDWEDWKTWALIALLFIGLSPFVLGQPPTQTNINIVEGIQIFFPPFDELKAGQDFTFRVHLTDISTGLEMNNNDANCTLHFYNATGLEQIENVFDKDPNGVDHSFFILGSNFTARSPYAYRVYCNDSQIGGLASGPLYSSTTGKIIDEAQGTLYLVMVLGLFLTIFVLAKTATSIPKDKVNYNNVGEVLGVNLVRHLRPLAWAMVWTFITVTFYILSNLAYAYLPNALLATTFFTIFMVLAVISPFIVILWFLKLFVDLVESKELSHMIKTGVIGDGGAPNGPQKH